MFAKFYRGEGQDLFSLKSIVNFLTAVNRCKQMDPYQARQKVGTTVMGMAITPPPLHTHARVREREYSYTIASVLI